PLPADTSTGRLPSPFFLPLSPVLPYTGQTAFTDAGRAPRSPEARAETDGVEVPGHRKDIMKFGLYAELQTPPGKPYAELYAEIMRQMEHADQVGFDVYSIIEHHFFQEFSTSANPLAMICAVAQKTRAIRFRVALHTLPLCNPMRLAGEIAAADIITGG